MEERGVIDIAPLFFCQEFMKSLKINHPISLLVYFIRKPKSSLHTKFY
ncbi:hypothetical protein HMPREF0021_02106 [Acinetobacter baumannii 6013150]|nr:hypothetical protein HMPREF0021_02106 [Acinetobacter baumannii 6013150]